MHDEILEENIISELHSYSLPRKRSFRAHHAEHLRGITAQSAFLFVLFDYKDLQGPAIVFCTVALAIYDIY